MNEFPLQKFIGCMSFCAREVCEMCVMIVTIFVLYKTLCYLDFTYQPYTRSKPWEPLLNVK